MRPECPKNFGETISAGYTSVLAGRGPVWEIISLAWIGRNLVWSLQNYCTNCWDLLGLLSAPEKKYGLDNELMIEWLFSKAIFTSLNCHWSIWPEIDRSVLNYSCLFVSLSHGYLNPASSVLFNRIFQQFSVLTIDLKKNKTVSVHNSFAVAAPHEPLPQTGETEAETALGQLQSEVCNRQSLKCLIFCIHLPRKTDSTTLRASFDIFCSSGVPMSSASALSEESFSLFITWQVERTCILLTTLCA